MRNSPVLRDLKSHEGRLSPTFRDPDPKSDHNAQRPLRSHPEALAPAGLQIPNHLLVLGLQMCVWWLSQAWICLRVQRST